MTKKISPKDIVLNIVRKQDIPFIYETGVYCLYNKVSCKIYIGSTTRKHKSLYLSGIFRRFVEHINCLTKQNHCNKYLQRTWNKSNITDWEFQILEICDKEKCIEREQYYMDTLLHAQEYINTNRKDKRFRELSYNITPVAGKNRFYKQPKPIYQYTVQGIFIRSWKTIELACIEYNVAPTNLYRACNKNSGCRGYRWSVQKMDNLNLTEYQKSKEYVTKKPIEKQLYIFDLTGNFICSFKSYFEVKVYFKTNYNQQISIACIQRCLMKGRGKYKGFIWKSEEQVELCDIEDNAIVFLKDTFIGIFTNLRFVCVNLFNGSSVTWCNRGTYGKIKFKDYNVFKRKNIIVSQNINDYT